MFFFCWLGFLLLFLLFPCVEFFSFCYPLLDIVFVWTSLEKASGDHFVVLSNTVCPISFYPIPNYTFLFLGLGTKLLGSCEGVALLCRRCAA